MATEHRIYGIPFADVYELYIKKLERKGRDVADLDVVIEWLTGFDRPTLESHLAAKTNFRDFFAAANINANAPLIKGVICGVRIEEIEDPLMREIRYLDKLVDELGNGRPMSKILRTA